MIIIVSIGLIVFAPSIALPVIAGMLFWRWWSGRQVRRAR